MSSWKAYSARLSVTSSRVAAMGLLERGFGEFRVSVSEFPSERSTAGWRLPDERPRGEPADAEAPFEGCRKAARVVEDCLLVDSREPAVVVDGLAVDEHGIDRGRLHHEDQRVDRIRQPRMRLGTVEAVD